MSDLVPVRASINLPGLRRGEVADVDVSDPEIAALLGAQHLVPFLGEHDQPGPDPDADALPDIPVDEPHPDAGQTDAATAGLQ